MADESRVAVLEVRSSISLSLGRSLDGMRGLAMAAEISAQREKDAEGEGWEDS